MAEYSPLSPGFEDVSTGPRWSVARVLAYLLVIGVGLAGGMVLALVAGFSMGWITISC